MKKNTIPRKTNNEYYDWFQHVKKMHAEDVAHCGVSFLVENKWLVFWCFFRDETKITVYTYGVINSDIGDCKEKSFWLLDEVLAKWKNDACKSCRTCQEFRDKHCDCFSNKNIRRFSNTILKSLNSKDGK